jgi:hypothetical protein
MKFTSILRQVIEEQSRFEILRDALTKPSKNKEGKTVKPKMTVQEFLQLVQSDPTTRMNNVDPETADPKELEKIKAGKFVNWLIKNYLKPVTERQPGDPGYDNEVKQVKSVFMEDLYKVTLDLQKFERFKNKLPTEQRNIDNLTPSSLYDAVKDFSLEKTKASAQEKEEAKKTYAHPGAEIVFRGNDWTIAKISDKSQLGKDAACFYGGYYLERAKGESRWCTSGPGLNHFDRYIKDGPLYVIIPNKFEGKFGEKSGLPVERFQFHFPSNQFMDIDDRPINLVEYLNGPMSELKEFFKPEFAKGLTVGDKKLVIEGFSHGAIGKFIALYGLDELIDSLPDTLQEFQIQNRETNDIIIKIPDSISRFKDLKMILFENCIESVPDSICKLSNLRFLALVNNKKLTNLPDCIGELPNLLFLNCKGSPNVKIPESIKRRATDYGENMFDLQD